MILRTLGAALCLGLPLSAVAQTNLQPLPDWLTPQAPTSSGAPTPGFSPPEGSDCCAPPPEVPVDGGLSLLALAGAGYAARRLRKRRA